MQLLSRIFQYLRVIYIQSDKFLSYSPGSLLLSWINAQEIQSEHPVRDESEYPVTRWDSIKDRLPLRKWANRQSIPADQLTTMNRILHPELPLCLFLDNLYMSNLQRWLWFSLYTLSIIYNSCICVEINQLAIASTISWLLRTQTYA